MLEQTQPTLDQLLSIHEHERQRLGQELHDSAGQLVVSLRLSVARLRRTKGGGGRLGVIHEIEETVGQIDREIRSLAFLHYPAELADRCLPVCIESLALGFGRRTGIHTTFESIGDSEPVDDSISMALLRVAQEALVNVHRHAHALSTRVVLKNRGGWLDLRISDDGVGISTPDAATDSSGIGLKGMRHRIEEKGGQFEIRAMNPGTMVCVRVPAALVPRVG